MDRFRVQALEKMVDSGCLNKSQRLATIKILIQKLEIIINGMKKRGKDDAAVKWKVKLNKYLLM